MRAKISASALGQELAAVLTRVRDQGQSFLIKQNGEAVAILEPLGLARGATWRTLVQALHELPDSDADFAADLEEVQRSQPEVPATMWPS